MSPNRYHTFFRPVHLHVSTPCRMAFSKRTVQRAKTKICRHSIRLNRRWLECHGIAGSSMPATFRSVWPIPYRIEHNTKRWKCWNSNSLQTINSIWLRSTWIGNRFGCEGMCLSRQPVWVTSANHSMIFLHSSLAYETKIPRQKLKIILPSLAYYFTTGPWRLMWVRFGYDPRKDFTSRYYQTLDYRIRSNTLKEKVTSNWIELKKKHFYWLLIANSCRSPAVGKAKLNRKTHIHTLKWIVCPRHDNHFIE